MPMATMADAHREWHQNTGVPMGTPGCPQDACHLPDDYAEGATHSVVTPYGNVPAYSMAEAAQIAREAAQATGKACKVVRLEVPLETTAQEVQARAEAMATPSLDALAARMTGQPTPEADTFCGHEECDGEPCSAERRCHYQTGYGLPGMTFCGASKRASQPYCDEHVREVADLGYKMAPQASESSPAGRPETGVAAPDTPAGEPEDPTLYDGIYTVLQPCRSGDADCTVDCGWCKGTGYERGGDVGHRTFRLRTQGPEEDFAPGKQVIAYLSGRDNTKDYTGFGFVHPGGRLQVWNAHRANKALAAQARDLLDDLPAKVADGRVLLAAHCFRCHHLLTVPTSVYAGLGPDCAKKAGL
jgi:hypothetical protein